MVKCEDCEEEQAEYICKDCGAYLCCDCADTDHGCFESRIDELRDKLFKEIKKKKK